MERTRLDVVLRRGLWVLIALVGLTLGEYLLFFGMKRGNLPYMVVMNLADAALIAYFFMHAAQLWRKEE